MNQVGTFAGGLLLMYSLFQQRLKWLIAEVQSFSPISGKMNQQKMQEYQRLGVRLGLLINPKNRQVEIYRLGQEKELLESPASIDCNEVMPGFVLSLTRMW